MVQVKLWGSLRALAEDQDVLELEGVKTLKDVRDTLAQRFPRLKPQIDRGVSFAVDGVVYRDDWFQPVDQAKEVVMLPRVVGG